MGIRNVGLSPLVCSGLNPRVPSPVAIEEVAAPAPVLSPREGVAVAVKPIQFMRATSALYQAFAPAVEEPPVVVEPPAPEVPPEKKSFLSRCYGTVASWISSLLNAIRSLFSPR